MMAYAFINQLGILAREALMNHRERLEDCLSDGPVDRVPVALWRHFPVDDQRPDRLAAAIANFQKTYDFDLIKVTPASSFCLRDWEVEDVWRGASEGTREYVSRVIQEPEDWPKLPTLDPNLGSLGNQLTCLRLLIEEFGPEVPIIQTIFSPLSQAKNLVGQDALFVHMRRYPDALQAGLRIISETTNRFVEAALATGIDGVFYAVQLAQYDYLSESEYGEFGRRYDLQVLEAAQEQWLNLLHLHGEQIMFDLFMDYPVSVLNWHDRETPPSLQDAQEQFPGVVCGGLRRQETMVLGTPEDVTAEAKDAIDATGGQRYILGTGCVTPTTAPYGNILAARQSVEL
jgi:uroporphyrinogen decarboxylase